jgi:lipoprotein-releasing system ATP-binding protein
MSEPVLELRNITRTFSQGGRNLEVLRGCTIKINAGEPVALIGPSGSGKSTLLQIAGLLESASGGQVIINGRDTSSLGDDGRTALRRQSIGFVYQAHHLLPEFSAAENIMLPQMIKGVPRRVAMRRADELLGLVELTNRADHRPARLSGGEQQRVALVPARWPMRRKS